MILRNIIKLLFLSILIINNNYSYSTEKYCNDIWYEGDGTQYGGVAGSSGGNCGLLVDIDDFYHCAMNHI